MKMDLMVVVCIINKIHTVGAVSDFDGQDGTSPFIQSHKSVSSYVHTQTWDEQVLFACMFVHFF